MVAPFQGQEVCRSGRTTGWSCGQVDETGIYVVGGRTTDPADLRAFRGFLSNDVQSSGGDSGGPWISGNFAVGTHSAGETSGDNYAIATTLEDALTRFPTAVELQLFLNKPELVAPENLTFTAGQPITGRVPAAPASAVAANSKVRITAGNADASGGAGGRCRQLDLPCTRGHRPADAYRGDGQWIQPLGRGVPWPSPSRNWLHR